MQADKIILVTLLSSCLAVDCKELNFEDERRVRRNNWGEATSAIGVVRRADQVGLLTERQLLHTLVPASNHLTHSDPGTEGLTTVTRGVELIAVRLKLSNIVHIDRITRLRESFAVTWSNCVHLEAHFQCGGRRSIGLCETAQLLYHGFLMTCPNY